MSKMNKDGVATAFELISEEIESLAEWIAQEGSKAFKEKRYPYAQELADTGENLRAFKTKVDQLLEEWENGFDQVTRTRTKIESFIESKPGHPKSGKKRLRVKFKDGTEISEHVAADTFVETLTKIGLSKVEPLGISVRGVSLVGDTRSTKYKQRRVSGKYIITHSSTPEKANILKDISKRLGLGLAVDVLQ